MLALLVRDLRLATRSGSGIGLGLAFFLILVLISAIGMGRDTARLAAASPGILWTGALLATLLSLDRLFQPDYEDGSLDVLAISPLPLEMVVAVKAIVHWLTAGLPLVLLSPVMALMLNLPTAVWPTTLLSLAIGTIGLSAIGTIGGALTLGIRRGGLLLSLLTTPLYVPTLIYGVTAIRNASDGQGPETALLLLAGLTLASLVLAPIAAAAALRINLG